MHNIFILTKSRVQGKDNSLLELIKPYLLVGLEPAGETLAVLVTQTKVPDLSHSDGTGYQLKQMLASRFSLEGNWKWTSYKCSLYVHVYIMTAVLSEEWRSHAPSFYFRLDETVHYSNS